MYYKSILLIIKEENNNRLTITNETIKDKYYYQVLIKIFTIPPNR